jgi:hypothetical protein
VAHGIVVRRLIQVSGPRDAMIGEVASGACGTGIEDKHVHPMVPRSARVSARWNF